MRQKGLELESAKKSKGGRNSDQHHSERERDYRRMVCTRK